MLLGGKAGLHSSKHYDIYPYKTAGNSQRFFLFLSKRSIMRLLTGILGLLLIVSCQQKSAITTTLEKADSMTIQFSNSATNNLTTDKTAIQKLASFIGHKEKALPLECEVKPSGMIVFYLHGQLQEQVTFTDLSQKCRYFITIVNGKTIYSEVGHEAADLLTAIQQGKSSY